MKVFISSVITGMEQYRDAAAVAVRSLGHEVIRAEDFGASPETPQTTCLTGVRQADLVVLLLGTQYGAVQPSGLSATHEEYREAIERSPVLIMVERNVQRNSEQTEFLREVQDWRQGQYTEPFGDADELRDAVVGALHRVELAQATGPVDAEEMLQRALSLMPQERHVSGNGLALVVTGGPLQPILRPAQLEEAVLRERLLQEALFGEASVLDTREGTDTRIVDDALILEQQSHSLKVNEQGSIGITIGLIGPDVGMSVVIEEEVRDGIKRCLKYAVWLLDLIDRTNRLTHCAVAAAIVGGSFLAWRTREEHAQSPNQVTMSGLGGDRPQPVNLSPPHRTRSALRLDPGGLAEDLTVLLRRRWRT